MAYTPHTLFFLLLCLPFFSHAYQSCPVYVNYACPDFHGTSLFFPFTNNTLPDCGYCVLECKNGTKIQCGSQKLSYTIKEIFPSNHTLILAYPGLDKLTSDACKVHRNESILIPNPPSISTTILRLMVFVRCRRHPGATLPLEGPYKACGNDAVYGPYPNNKYSEDELPPDCSIIQLPNSTSNKFSIQYRLYGGCSQCIANKSGCFDPKTRKRWCPGKGRRLRPAIILASSLVGTMVLITVFLILMRRKLTDTFKWDNQKFETFLESYGSLVPKRYTYSDIKSMTNWFKVKLGEGGFGGVYKGKLLDGRPVAVKLLKHSKAGGEDFINEVASIGRTNHVNVVTLLGFCCSGKKRALVYEFMANGSLEKFTNDGTNYDQSLPWETLFNIALGIARGLEYLHRGCKTRILHFDIKPHNILLDEDFCPKISDFGLAKISHQNKQSKVTMSAMRGTIGYIAPEMVCRNFGDVSHKSDVYSYGMMVLEIIGSRKRQNATTGCSSELYFPHWIYKQLEQGGETEVDSTITDFNLNDEDKRLKRKMILVSLWCIQTLPSSRPSMSAVVQMLEGSVELIQIPPMPTCSSPQRSQWDPSGSSMMTS